MLSLVVAITAVVCGQLDQPGPHAVDTAANVSVMAAGRAVNVDVYSPADRMGAPFPIVILGHGFARTNDNVAGHAAHLASWGMVVLAPDFPSRFAPDHVLNGQIMRDLLTFARGGPAPIGAIVDPLRSAYVGHSAGGLAAFLAASRDLTVTALVGLDPVDTSAIGVTAAPTIAATTLVLGAEPSRCNSNASADALYAAVAAPERWFLRVTSATHCDGEDPSNGLCTSTCGGEDAVRRATFRRYMTAHLLHAFACGATDWIPGGAMLMGDARVTSLASAGAFACVGPVDAGVGMADATIAFVDAAAVDAAVAGDAAAADDDAATANDAASADDAAASFPDASVADASSFADASVTDALNVVAPSSGCGCETSARGAPSSVLLLLLATLVRRRR